MDINPTIFRAYDIRGIYPDELADFTAYKIGRAYINFLRNNPVVEGPIRIVVTSDARTSSPVLKEELIKGMCEEDSELTVIDAGLSTTPMHYFLINHLKADGGVMVTASHNPKEYNGFKLSRKEAISVSLGLGMEEIKNTAVRGIFETKEGRGKIVTEEHLADYVEYLSERVRGKSIKNFSIIFDTGNGMVGLVLSRLLQKLPVRAKILFEDIDMTFPNHEANPINDKTLGALQDEVIRSKADFGVAFDGDGDRISFVTSPGRRIPGDHLLAMLAERMITLHPGAKIVYDLARTGKAVREYIHERGGVEIVSRVGRSFVKDAMRKEDAVLGGEFSGHYFFKDFFYSDSALVTFLEMLILLSETSSTLEDLDRPLQKYASSGEVNIHVKDRDKALDAVAAHYHDAPSVSYADGLSIEYPDFWFNVRPSNTEPLLRLTMEAASESILKEKVTDVRRIIEEK